MPEKKSISGRILTISAYAFCISVFLHIILQFAWPVVTPLLVLIEVIAVVVYVITSVFDVAKKEKKEEAKKKKEPVDDK
ncbi:MAG: hypothetical protein H7289_01130 [Mucilaginibacter sp.]|nr:hypothetical protein [Mucilaginibacter sp.]